MTKPRHNANGEGSVFYEPARKRWVGLTFVDLTDGRRVRLKVTGRTKTEARRRMDELRRSAEVGVVPDRTATVESFLLWWAGEVQASLSPITLAGYREIMRRYIL